MTVDLHKAELDMKTFTKKFGGKVVIACSVTEKQEKSKIAMSIPWSLPDLGE